VQLLATCDRDATRAEEHARLRGCAPLLDAADLPRELDVVVVSSPTSTHRAVAEPLLRRGVSCLVEKPIASSLEDADAMIDAAKVGGAILAVGHAERWNAGLLRVREAITAPLFVEGHRLAAFPERSLDVDVVLDLMIHDLDLLLWLAGGELVDVAAIGVSVLTPRVDIATARLVLSSGCAANLTASRVSAEPTRKLRLFQEDAYVSVDLHLRTAEVVRLDRTAMPRPEMRRDKTGPDPATPDPEPLRLEQAAFLEAVRRRGGSPGVSGEEGRRALDAALRVLAAMEAHRELVETLRKRG
jgi:predicted dehydrogenase